MYIATLIHIATIARLEAIVVDRRATARTALDHTAVVRTAVVRTAAQVRMELAAWVAVRTAAQATLQAQVTLVAAAWEVADKLKFECTNFRIRHPLNFVH
jgi:hypothetical protein